MRKRRHIILLLVMLAGPAVLLSACSSDSEGPVSVQFLDSLYGVIPGDVIRYVEPLDATVFEVQEIVGSSRLLAIGRERGLRFHSIFIQFDMTLSEEDIGKEIESASLRLPVRVAPEGTEIDTIVVPYVLDVSLYELSEAFDEDDTLLVHPALEPVPLPNSTGSGVRALSIENTEFYIDPGIVAEWLSGAREHLGIAIVLVTDPDEPGLIEMNSHEYGSDPPAIDVMFADSTTAAYASINDYSAVDVEEGGLICVGGVARRIHFTFDLAGVDPRAIVHRSNLVLTVIGGEGFGATTGEATILGLLKDFDYYIYAPDTLDFFDPKFLKGKGIDLGSFDPVESKTLRLPLRGFIPDIIKGDRVNTGVIIQSNREAGRIQKVAFQTSSADSLYRPYLEVIYSLPAEFTDTP
jgi:hypothetical protein